MDKITQARYNFILAFQIFREISVGKQEDIHTGYCAIDLLDEALNLHPNFQEARDLRGEIWHAILIKNFDENYNNRYLNSKAWDETRDKCFDKFGYLCPCGFTATQVHHKTYANVGKENFLTDLVILCDSCHDHFHELRNSNGVSDVKGREYWDSFKTYMEKNASDLQLFPNRYGKSIYGIEIDGKTRKNNEIVNKGAFWLVAYRDRNKLQANLCTQLWIYYDYLKKQRDNIQEKFENNLGELKCDDSGKRIGFHNNNVGNVAEADRDEEFLWLRDRLVKLHTVFQPLVLKLQEGT